MNKLITSGIFILALAPLSAMAEEEPLPAMTEKDTAIVDGTQIEPVLEMEEQPYFSSEKIAVGLSLGTLKGKTHERVYNPAEGGRKISELAWKYNEVPILKGFVDLNFTPRLTLGISGWTALGNRDSTMDDYDWFNPNSKQWTEHSHHRDTNLKKANEYDVNVKGWIFNTPNWRLGVMAGYQENQFGFDAEGGSFSYNNGAFIGQFRDGLKVIKYDQHYKFPYIGFAGDYRRDEFEYSGVLKYSAWGRASDVDEHLLRDITFFEEFDRQNFYSFAGKVSYYLTKRTKVYVEGAWSHAQNKKGDVTLRNNKTGAVTVYENSGGIANENFTLTLGLKYAY